MFSSRPFGWPAQTRSLVLRLCAGNAVATYFVLILFTGSMLPPSVSTAETITDPSPGGQVVATPKTRPLVLGFKCGDAADAERLRKHTTALLSLASCVNEFDCRLSTPGLNCTRPSKIAVDGPFEDVLLDVPVRGDARFDGLFKIVPLAHAEHAALRVTLEGTVTMDAIGHSHGMRIKSEAVTHFSVVKPLFLDVTGITSQPATCTTQSTITTKSVTSAQPRLMARFAERIALQRVTDTRAAAEAECSEHVAASIRAAVDREIDALTTAANAAIKDHLAAASEAERAQWRQVRFRTDAEFLHIGRHEGKGVLVGWKPDDGNPVPAIVVRLPRGSLDLTGLLTRLHVFDPAKGEGEAAPGTNPPRQPLPPLKSTLSWQPDALTVSIDFPPAARLAQEPTVGIGQ